MPSLLRNLRYAVPILFSGNNPALQFKNDINAYSPIAFYDANSSTLYQANTASGDLADANGDVVGYWEDLSGNGYHATQGTTANKPTFRTNVQSNLSVLRFALAGDWLRNTAFADFSDTYSLFAVRKYTTDTPNNRGLVEVSNGTVNTGFSFLHDANGDVFRARDASVLRDETSSANGLDSVWRVQSGVNNGSQIEQWLNGTSTGTTAYTAPNPNTTNQLDIGSLISGAFRMDGDISTVIVFNTALSDTDRASIETILNNRYGVY